MKTGLPYTKHLEKSSYMKTGLPYLMRQNPEHIFGSSSHFFVLAAGLPQDCQSCNFGKKTSTSCLQVKFVTFVTKPPKVVTILLLILICFGPNLSKFCYETTVGNAGVCVVSSQLEVYSKIKRIKGNYWSRCHL